MKVIYITNLPGEVNKSELFAMLFAKKLNIVDCDVFRYTREHDDDGNAYSFAELGSEEEAKNAIELLNDTEFMNRKLLVNNFVLNKFLWKEVLIGFCGVRLTLTRAIFHFLFNSR